jgi:WD40 repeat protein
LQDTTYIVHLPQTFLFLDNNTLVIGFGNNPIIRSYDLKTKAEIKQLIGHTSSVLALIQLNDNQTIASASGDCKIKVWNHTNGSLLNTLIGHSLAIRDLVLLRNGNLASCSEDSTIKIWNLSHSQPLQSLKVHKAKVLCIAMIKSDLLVSGSFDKTIQLWNITSGGGLHIGLLTDDNDQVWSLLLLPSGSQLASAEFSLIKIWNIETTASASLITCLEGHVGIVYHLVNLNQNHLASASGDLTIKIWNHESGALLKTLIGHTDIVLKLALLSDGNLASLSKTIKTWNSVAIFKYPNTSNLMPYQDW